MDLIMRYRRPSIMRTAEFRMLTMSTLLASSTLVRGDIVKYNYNLPKDPIICLVDSVFGRTFNVGKKIMHDGFAKMSKFVK